MMAVATETMEPEESRSILTLLPLISVWKLAHVMVAGMPLYHVTPDAGEVSTKP